MQSYSDFEEILLAFNAAGVSYLIVGAFAVAAHARPRATGDIDLWVQSTLENSARIYAALAAFGAPLEHIDERTFVEPEIIFQIGVPPIRVDILTSIDGVTFDEAWKNRVAGAIGAVPVQVLGRSDLIRNKVATGRPKDLADISLLEGDVQP
jgi:hypothetical protein